MMKRSQLTNTILSILLLAISAVGFLTWNINAPICQDDFYYRTIMQGDDQAAFSSCEGPRIETFGDALYSAKNVQLYDHGRWANVLHVLFTPFPTTIERVFTALVFIISLILLCRFVSSRKQPDAFSVMTVIILVWTVFPWYDSLVSLAYQANYIWTTFVTLLYIILLPLALKTESKLYFSLFLLLCVIVSWGHEAFGIAAGAYTLGMWPSISKKERRKTLYFIAALFIGFCIVVYCGIGRRLVITTTEGGYSPSALKYMITRIISRGWPIFIAYAVFCVRYLLAGANKADYFKRSLPTILAMAPSLLIEAVVQTDARVFWPAFLMAIIFLSQNILDLSIRIQAKIKYFIAGVFAVIYTVWMVQLVRWQIRMTTEYYEVYNSVLSLADSPTEVYPGPYTPTSEVPFYLMGIPGSQFDNEFTPFQMTSSVKPRYRAQMLIATDQAMTGPFEQWPKIPGTAGVRGVYPWIAVADTSIQRIHMVLGPPPANKTPLDKLFILLKEGSFSNNTEVEVFTNYFDIHLADSSVVYRLCHEPLGRTLTGRKVLQIDTIPD